jgi:hypothetical protein
LVIKDAVAHRKRLNNPDPDLACLVRQVRQRLAKLRIDTQTPVEFFQGCNKLLAVSALPSNVRQGE